MKWMWIAPAAALLLVACVDDDDDDLAQSRTLSVSGTGAAAGVPDMAMLNFAVVSQAKTAGEATAANASSMTGVRDALSELGVAPRDMQTSGFSLSPRYAQNERGFTDRNVIIGYEANNTLTVRLRDTTKVGGAIDAAVAAGANQLNSLNFGFSDEDELLEEARRNAVREAVALAELLADEAGIRLGPVRHMSISSYRPSPQPIAMRSAAMA